MGRPDYYGNPAGVTTDVDTVRGIYDAFARRDVEGVLGLIAPDCELHIENTARLAGREPPYRGREGVRRYLADVESVWDDMQLDAGDFRAIPGAVIVIGHVRARRAGEESVRAVVWTWRLRDGLAVSLRSSDMGELRN
jgi:ketosteroid isomerase-like protein